MYPDLDRILEERERLYFLEVYKIIMIIKNPSYSRLRMEILIKLINVNFGFIKTGGNFLAGRRIIGFIRYKFSLFIWVSYHVSLPAGNSVALANL
jgi:hypothetical protein